ncbi:hypothetical protein C8Q70DRAFT_592090 [Cubamyces menziesii]|nr:hypothetical protein C8Q70DRAFT_592090 [Cubamyces menziesii]
MVRSQIRIVCDYNYARELRRTHYVQNQWMVVTWKLRGDWEAPRLSWSFPLARSLVVGGASEFARDVCKHAPSPSGQRPGGVCHLESSNCCDLGDVFCEASRTPAYRINQLSGS